MDGALAGMADAQLATLRANAVRLIEKGPDKVRAEASRLLPLVDEELAKRRAAKPPRPPRARRAAPTPPD